MRRAIAAVSLFVLLMSVGAGIVPAQEARYTYDWNQATGESYWYALYNLTALLASEMGIPLSIKEESLNRWAQEAGLSTEESSLLKQAWIAVSYASGDSTYVQSGSLNWAEDKTDRTVTTEAIAWLITSSISQAKQLEHLYQTGIAQTGETRLWATLLGHLAAEAARFAYANLRASETQLYVRAWKENVGVSDPSLRPLDQVWMLWALSELNSLSESSSFYRGTLSHAEVESWAVELFRAFSQYSQSHSNWLAPSPYQMGMLIEGISSYAATLSNGATLDEAVDFIENSAQALKEQIKKIGEASDSGEFSPLINLAEAVRALLVAQRMTGDDSFRQAALDGWTSLQSLWDSSAGVYRLHSRQAPDDYTLWDVGALVGAFSAMINGAGMTEAKEQYARFFQNTIKASHLMLAEGEEAGGGTDNDEVLAPDQAGGDFGRAPVFASSLQYNPGTHSWSVTNSRFYTAGALYLSARLIWIGQREAQPYSGPPRWGLPESKETQFISLRKQVAELGEDRKPSEQIEALKLILTNLQDRVEELRKQESIASIVAQDMKDLKGKVENLEQKVNSELAGLNQKLATLESKIAAPPSQPTTRGKLTLPDTLTVVLIVLILLLGFVAYQRVLQQKQPA